MGTPGARSRRPSRAGRGAAAACLCALIGLLATASSAHAEIGYNESLRVDAAGTRVTRTTGTLLAGHTYRVDVAGLYRVDDITADAECSMSQLDAMYSRDSANSVYELLVNGRDIDWTAARADLTGCDANTHEYSFSFRPTGDGPVEFALNIPPGADGARGTLDLQITGDAAASPPATTAPTTPTTAPTAAPTTAPTTRSVPTTAAPPSTAGTVAPLPKADAPASPDARASLSDLLGPDQEPAPQVLEQAAKERGGVMPDYPASSGSPLGTLVVLSLAALAAGAAATAPVRRRVLAGVRGIDALDIAQRQTAHRAHETTATPRPEPVKIMLPRPSQRRMTHSAVAHRGARPGRVPTLIVDDLPSTGIAGTAVCTCGYCS